jgi:antitoxin VapB
MHTARIFINGNSQAVRLPKQFRVDAAEVFIRKDPVTGDIVLSTRPTEGAWAEFFALRDKTRFPSDFMDTRPMNAVEVARDPFEMAAPINGAKANVAKSVRTKRAARAKQR